MNINTLNDWMNELAEAIREGNQEKLNELDNISYGWLQGSEERGAQQNVIEACYEALNTY